MEEKILFVDDEPNVLDGIRRQLRKRYKVETAVGPEEGLDKVRDVGPFAVIVSDMKMPVMSGATFLAKVRELNPESVRMILSGQSELESAVDAVNNSGLFRFLTKPCDIDTLTSGLDAALGQYRLLQTERELLDRTLTGSVKVLTEVLGMTHPKSFSRTSRVAASVMSLAEQLEIEEAWRIRVAASLSQLGLVALPDEVVEGYHKQIQPPRETVDAFRQHAEVGSKLLESIPRLEDVAEMIARQFEDLPVLRAKMEPNEWEPVLLGAQLLRVCHEFDRLTQIQGTRAKALCEMESLDYAVPTALLEALRQYSSAQDGVIRATLTVEELRSEMLLEDDVVTNTGVVLVRRGDTLTDPMLARIRNFQRGVGVKEPVTVLRTAEQARLQPVG